MLFRSDAGVVVAAMVPAWTKAQLGKAAKKWGVPFEEMMQMALLGAAQAIAVHYNEDMTGDEIRELMATLRYQPPGPELFEPAPDSPDSPAPAMASNAAVNG